MSSGGQGEMLGQKVVERVCSELSSALRRRSPHETRLAGVLRALAPRSQMVLDATANAAELLVRRGSFSRILFVAAIRTVGEARSPRAGDILSDVLLKPEKMDGLAAISAACFVTDPCLANPLARLAISRHPQIAFAAEVARAARGESDGQHLVAIAPKIKESHRIELCLEMFVPLTRVTLLPRSVTPALAVLRDAERHLGRWLVLAEVAANAKDPGPLLEAQARSKNGPGSAKAAWALVAWALARDSCPPTTRPTVELVARLSDRPSADRDTTFLFRLASAKAPAVRPMLEALAKSVPLADESAVRAALYLLRDHDRHDLLRALESTAKAGKREDLRGMAVAALWDAGFHDNALRLALPLLRCRSLPAAAWAALVEASASHSWQHDILDEPTFRRIQWGWLE